MDFSVLTRTFIAVFVMADAVGNAPLVLILTKGMEPAQRDRTIDRAALVATSVLLGFAFAGQTILDYLQISIGALRVAGGLLLLLIALQMLQGELDIPVVETDSAGHDVAGRDVAISPLALPLLAGPGTMTTVMVLMSDAPKAQLSVIAGIISAMFITWLIVRQSVHIDRLIGPQGAIIATKILGFLLAALAIEIGSEGIRELFLK